jgi:hypothetical protein
VAPSVEERMARLEALFVAHEDRDDQQFGQVNGKLDTIGADVKSLLATRAFNRGVMRTAAWLSGAIATVVSIVVAWLG